MAFHQCPGQEVKTFEAVETALPTITWLIAGESCFLEISETHPRLLIFGSLSPLILALHAILGIEFPLIFA